MKYYTGVGSRDTSVAMQAVIRQVAYKLANAGFWLRSGAADGADRAFEAGWQNARLDHVKVDPNHSWGMKAEIYIPWDGFNGHTAQSLGGNCYVMRGPIRARAAAIAAEIHPAWDKCSEGAKKLHTRNVFQVLGQDLETPSKFLICWAEVQADGKPKGGTATAWNLADKYDIPCFNLEIKDHMDRIMKFVEAQ